MNPTPNDDDPAFPPMVVFPPSGGAEKYDGMFLRDYFAAAALMGGLANITTLQRLSDSSDAEKNTLGQLFARRSYAIADAMLAERSSHAETC